MVKINVIIMGAAGRDFHNFNTPQLEPGESDNFALDIQNRYAYSRCHW